MINFIVREPHTIKQPAWQLSGGVPATTRLHPPPLPPPFFFLISSSPASFRRREASLVRVKKKLSPSSIQAQANRPFCSPLAPLVGSATSDGLHLSSDRAALRCLGGCGGGIDCVSLQGLATAESEAPSGCSCFFRPQGQRILVFVDRYIRDFQPGCPESAQLSASPQKKARLARISLSLTLLTARGAP